MMIRLFLNGGFFYLGFFIAVIGGATGAFWWGPLFFLCILTIHLCFYGHPKDELLFVMILSLLGAGAESLLIHAHVITYPGAIGALPPLWIISLYGMYAMTVDHSLRWLRHHKLLTIPLGMGGAILSYMAGERLGAAEFLMSPQESLFAIAIVWGVIAPFSFILREMVGSERK